MAGARTPIPSDNATNAIVQAKKPVADKLMAEYPSALIHTSGFEVGLPEGTMGNSEVGHQNIGAGRIVDQESGRITKAIVERRVLREPGAQRGRGFRPEEQRRTCTCWALSPMAACTACWSTSTAAWNWPSARA